LEYDLLTRTHYQLDDVGGALSWSSLYSFIRNVGSDSALVRDLGKQTGWEVTLRTNALLADIYDLLQIINKNLCHSKKKIKPYPRPGDKPEDKRIGKGALPFDKLRDWIKERQHG
jgi:hypothetical protein